ncbi:hypothetical protein NQ315_016471 [Exocentrus adspersus]|uniref:PHD-type domain-containing protein n=1 Tax=Exocentrus adspersus TaxID=1586481 RepID=A0AAV8VYI2_9CUCU|nr:hypothetical protein NQ315_016471 [Exocentrus adspersus]
MFERSISNYKRNIAKKSIEHKSSEAEENEKSCDIVSSSENKENAVDNIEKNLNGDADAFSKSINSPNVSSTNQEEGEQQSSSSDHDSLHNESSEVPCKNAKESHDTCEKSENQSSTADKHTNDVQIVSNTKDTKKNIRVGRTLNEIQDDPLFFVSDKTDESTSNAEINNGTTIENERKTEGCKDGSENNGVKDGESNTKSLDDNNTSEIISEEGDFPLLKETLSKRKDSVGGKETGVENGINDIDDDDDDDFDPSLLCPDIAMEVDEAPVITSSENIPSDGTKSPQLYDPVYSTYVDEMTGAEVSFNLTSEEHQLRHDTYGEKNPVQYTKIHCTACNVHLGSALDGQTNRFVHPLLKVLICKDCYHFYTSGEFEKDEDGSELYCRWCGQGGQVMCCSNCEMVFCKKCIRINFGRKKLTEIRDSDDWFCFRCNPAQLISLRVHCAEFMEYVRREISVALLKRKNWQTLVIQVNQKKKKRKIHHDPDYQPVFDKPELNKPNKSVPAPVRPEVQVVTSKPVSILPKTTDVNRNADLPMKITKGGIYRVGNTTFRPTTICSPSRPVVPTASSVVRPQLSGSGYLKIVPGAICTATPVRQPNQSGTGATVRPQTPCRPIRVPKPTPSPMKHEWFEKTVRSAARVNSNLSYTLTQLNRAQASATSVEALAVVHNKLQEILSSSINTLIQIRKNLRTEFIAGIKNIRFLPKPAMAQPRPQPTTSAQDDDVIFVSPSTSPVPPPLVISNSTNLPPSVTLTNTSATPKKTSVPEVPTTTLQLITGTNTTSSGERPLSFIRVKSLSALQNVTSECITIPDDPVPLPEPPLISPTHSKDVTVVEDSPKKDVDTEITKDSPIVIEDGADAVSSNTDSSPPKNDKPENKESVSRTEETNPVVDKDDDSSKENVSVKVCKKDKQDAVEQKNNETDLAIENTESSNKEVTEVINIADSSEDKSTNLNHTVEINDPSSAEMKKMLNAKVYLERSEKIDKLVKKKLDWKVIITQQNSE